MFPKSCVYLMYPSGREPIESVWKGEEKPVRLLGKPSVSHVQADQLDLLLRDTSCASLPHC